MPLLGLNPRMYGLSEPLSQDLELIDELLGEVIEEREGGAIPRACRALFEFGKESPIEDPLTQISGLDDPEIVRRVARAYTVLFQLINIAEQKEIVRVNRARPDRPESIAATMASMRKEGWSADDLRKIIEQIEIAPTLTAHPTEARRRAVLDKLEQIAGSLVEASRSAIEIDLSRPLGSALMARRDLKREISLLWQTAEMEPGGMNVEDEVENALYYFDHSIFRVCGWIQRDITEAWREQFHQEPAPDASHILQYRSWVGGDRDGNPNVTADLTWHTLNRHRETFVNHAVDLCRRLAVEDTQAADQLGDRSALDRIFELWHAGGGADLRQSAMPFAALFEAMADRLEEDPRYASTTFAANIRSIDQSLRESGSESAASSGPFARLFRLAGSFPQGTVPIDIRQHSDEHMRPVAELLTAAGVISAPNKYTDAPEARKAELIWQELANPRPLVDANWRGSEQTERVREVFRTIFRAHREFGPASIQCYIVSMTHGVSDVAEPILLAKDSGLLHYGHDQLESALDFVPLLETIDDLNYGTELLNALFDQKVYRQLMESRNRSQEVMLGYSDSSKDGGYFAANWALHQAQRRLAEEAKSRGYRIQFFHGRGGTVGRGGGRANRAIQSQPPGSFDGRMRFTEQGEVISFRYSLRPIAHRHVEQIVAAAILASIHGESSDAPPESFNHLAQIIADASRSVYQDLVYHDPRFIEFYRQATPIDYISQLSIASRPVMRPGKKLDSVDGLRAIPWNFAWVQTRYVVPGWYGFGSGLAAAAEKDQDALMKMARDWPFFATVLENAELELTRTNLSTSQLYLRNVDLELAESFHRRIEEEFHLTVNMIGKVVGRELMSGSSVVKATVDFRNPITLPLNVLQSALIGRAREGHDVDGAILQTLAGLAAGMQSTG